MDRGVRSGRGRFGGRGQRRCDRRLRRIAGQRAGLRLWRGGCLRRLRGRRGGHGLRGRRGRPAAAGWALVERASAFRPEPPAARRVLAADESVPRLPPASACGGSRGRRRLRDGSGHLGIRRSLFRGRRRTGLRPFCPAVVSHGRRARNLGQAAGGQRAARRLPLRRFRSAASVGGSGMGSGRAGWRAIGTALGCDSTAGVSATVRWASGVSVLARGTAVATASDGVGSVRAGVGALAGLTWLAAVATSGRVVARVRWFGHGDGSLGQFGALFGALLPPLRLLGHRALDVRRRFGRRLRAVRAGRRLAVGRRGLRLDFVGASLPGDGRGVGQIDFGPGNLERVGDLPLERGRGGRLSLRGLLRRAAGDVRRRLNVGRRGLLRRGLASDLSLSLATFQTAFLGLQIGGRRTRRRRRLLGDFGGGARRRGASRTSCGG